MSMGNADFLLESGFIKDVMSLNLFKALKEFFGEALEGIYQYYGLEKRLNMNNIIPGCWGTADMIIQAPGAAYVLDYKFGRGEVDPGSLQLQVYTAGYYKKLQKAGQLDNIETFYSVIIQPRLSSRPKIKEYSKKEVENYINKYYNELRKMKAENQYNVGPWCEKFAKCAALCPAYREKRRAVFTSFLDK